jgi:diacylglycerol kinase (ATP)
LIQKIVFIINSLRKLPDEVKDLLFYCENYYKQHPISVLYTQHAGHSKELAFTACRENNDLIVGVGGDGTFHEIVNGIILSGNKNVILSLIPNGTGNDFCRAQQIKFSKDRFIKSIVNPKVSLYDVCQLNTTESITYFINIADIGFGGYTAFLLNQQRVSGFGGGISYTIAILRSFFTFRKPKIELSLDGKLYYSGPIMMVAFCNSSTFGNGLIIHPEATPNDGHLKITFLGDVGFWDYLMNYRNLKNGNRIKHRNVVYLQCQNASIRKISGRTPIEADGEIIKESDIYLEIIPQYLPVLKY